MKKLLSIVLSLAMILSTIIIPSAVVVSAEDAVTVEVLEKTYYVSATGSDLSAEEAAATETPDVYGDGTAEHPYATIAKAETVAAALEDEDTIVNATIMISGELSYAADVAHKGMFTIQGDGTTSSVLAIVSGTSFGPTGTYGSLLSGPVTIKDLVYKNSGNYIVTNGKELVVDLGALNAPETNTFAIMNVNGEDEKVTVNGYKSESWIASVFSIGSTKGAMGGLDFVYNSGRMRKATFNATTFNGNVNLTFNGVSKRSDEPLELLVTEGAVFNKAVQVIFNNKTGSTFTFNALASVNAAEGVWVMNGLSTTGTLTTTETAGTFAVNSTAIAQAKNTATGEVYFAENGYLTVPAGSYDFSFGGPAELYVSAEGSDETGDGTEANPYATINKAMTVMTNNIAGTIYVLGETAVDFDSTVAHSGMITIDGLGTGKINLVTNGWKWQSQTALHLSGPTTIQNIEMVKASNATYLSTNGNELILGENVTSTVADQVIMVGNTANSSKPEKVTINSYKALDWADGYGTSITVKPYVETPANGTIGDVDLTFNGGIYNRLTIGTGKYTGNVNVTFNGGSRVAGRGLTDENGIVAQSGQTPSFEGAVQFLFNNGLSKAHFIGTAFDSITATNGVWFVSSAKDAAGSTLETTETAGIFKVNSAATAIATNTEGDEALSEDGLLELSPGIWNVTYDYRVLYVSETGSDETGNGSEENPYASISKAMSLLGDKAGTVYVMGSVASSDVAHTGMITIKGYDENATLYIYGSWYNQIYEAWKLNGPTTLEDLRLVVTHRFTDPDATKDTFYKIVTQGQELVVNNCWTTQNINIYAGDYQVANPTTVNKLTVNSLKFRNEDNTGPAGWLGLQVYFGSFGDKTTYKSLGADVTINDANLKSLILGDSKSAIAGDIKVKINGGLLCTDGAYFTKIDTDAVQGNVEIISNNMGTQAITGITPSDTDLTHQTVAEGKGLWNIYGSAGGSLETTDVAGTYNVIGGAVATATNGTDTITSVDGVLTIPAGSWNVTYEIKDFYVSETGNDSTGDGTKDNPFLTVDKALASIGDKEGATIYVSGTVTLRYDTVRSNMVTITGVNGTSDIVAAGWGNTANAGTANPFKGPITFKNVSIKGNGQYWVTNGKDVVFDNVPITTGAHTFYVGNAEATQSDENVVVNNAGTRDFPLSYYFGTYGSATKTGKVNFEFNGGTFHSLRFKNGTFAEDVNIVVNNFTPRRDQSEWVLYVEGTNTFEKALQVIFNNNTYTTKAPKADQWGTITAAGGKWIIKGSTGGTLTTTDVAGKFAVTAEENNIAIAYDEEGSMVAKAENGILDLSNAEGVYTVSYVDASALLDAIYVSATEGSDDNIGSVDAPLATLKVAIEKAKALAVEEKVIYIMGTVSTLVNGASDYVTYADMITFKGYDEASALEFTTTWKNQVNNVYAFQGPTTIEDLRIISANSIMTNGNEVVINNCYMNTSLTVYVADHEKTEANAKLNKLTVNGLEFFNETFTAEAPWLGLNMYYGAFGGDAAQVSSGAAANFATGGVEVYVNGSNLKAFRLDRSRGYIAGDVKLTVDNAYIVPLSQGGYQTQIGSITDDVLTQVAIKGAYSVVVNNNIGTAIATGTYENAATNNLTMINAEGGAYFVYSADINGNTMAIGEEAGKFAINSAYSVEAKDAEGNVVTRASDVLDVEAGTYFVTYFNAADINADGVLDIRDLVAFKNEFANAETKNYAQFDISFDGAVDTADLASLQKHFLKVAEVKFAPVGDDLAFTYFEDAVLMSDDMAEEYKTVIYSEDDSNVPKNVTTYYVSSLKADSQNLGTEEHPFTSIEALNAAFADKVNDEAVLHQIVLFERGSVFRTSESLVLDSKTYYGAYGEGEKPQILGSLRDYADASLWTTENGGSIWQLQLPELAEDEEGSNIVVTKNGVEGIAKRVNSLASVDTTGEYYYDDETGIIYLYCDFINPAKYFDSIEISTTNAIVRNYDIKTPTDRVYNDEFIVENLCIKFAGIHTFALSDVNDSVIQYCEVGWAGGHSTASDGERYGNGIEIWNRAENVTIANNYIYQCYDAAVTFQGSAINQYNNVAYENNLIERCSFGFEFWAGTGLELKEIPEDATEEEIAAIEAENAEIQAQIDAKYAAAVMTEIYFQNNVMRLAAGGMGGACRSNLNTYKYQSFIQPFNFDASKLLAENVDVNIIGNVFDTSYRSFIWGTAEDDAGNYVTIDALTFEGNYYVQNTSIAPNVSLINGEVCETFADFEEAVYALDEGAELVEWYQ